MFDIITAYALIASGITANKFILKTLSPDLFVGIRMLLSGLLVFLYSLKNSPRMRWSYIKHDFIVIFLIAACTTFVPSLLKAFALHAMPASKTTLIGSIDPFITALYAYLLWGERLSWTKIFGIMLGFMGIIIAIMSTYPGEELWGELFHISLPELAVVGSVVISRYGWIVVQRLMKSERYEPTEITGMTMIMSGMLALLFAYFRGASTVLCVSSVPLFVFALLYTVIIANSFGYSLYARCLKRHKATWMSLTGFLVPLFVALYAFVLGQETLSWNFFAAAGVLLCGLCVFYYDELRSVL